MAASCDDIARLPVEELKKRLEQQKRLLLNRWAMMTERGACSMIVSITILNYFVIIGRIFVVWQAWLVSQVRTSEYGPV